MRYMDFDDLLIATNDDKKLEKTKSLRTIDGMLSHCLFSTL